MLLLDRYLGFHFFSVLAQGNPVIYVNLFWVSGHPEVYILIFAFGVFLGGLDSSAERRCSAIARWSPPPWRFVVSFLVWLLVSFFTMGASADVNGFFGVMTMIKSPFPPG